MQTISLDEFRKQVTSEINTRVLVAANVLAEALRAAIIARPNPPTPGAIGPKGKPSGTALRIRTGTLAAEIRVERTGKNGRGRISVIVPHPSHLIEYGYTLILPGRRGVMQIPPRPVVRPTVEKMRQRIEDIIRGY